jgi:hypothetical protein
MHPEIDGGALYKGLYKGIPEDHWLGSQHSATDEKKSKGIGPLRSGSRNPVIMGLRRSHHEISLF